MKVKEIIEFLKEQDQDGEVVVSISQVFAAEGCGGGVGGCGSGGIELLPSPPVSGHIIQSILNIKKIQQGTEFKKEYPFEPPGNGESVLCVTDKIIYSPCKEAEDEA